MTHLRLVRRTLDVFTLNTHGDCREVATSGDVMDRNACRVLDPVTIVHAPGHSRFEAHVDGRSVATLEYRLSGPAAVLTHTQLARGADVARRSDVIDAALDALDRSGYYAVALCPHVRAFLRAHPDRHLRVDTRFLDPVAPAC